MALVSVLAFGFGLVVLGREYDRLRRTGREALRPVVASWVRTVPVHYLGWTLADYADRWRRAPPAERADRLVELRLALLDLGDELDRPDPRSPLLEIVAIDVRPRGGPLLASWRPPPGRRSPPPDLADRIPLLSGDASGPPIDIAVQYHIAPEIERAAEGLEAPYHRLLLALLGLSIYPLLCLLYMGLQARALRDRAAREAAQAATLDLADRTCHELGNVAFILSNEWRNLADHLALVERFVAEEPEAVAAAAARTGLDPGQSGRLAAELRREYGDRGFDPAIELRSGGAIARVVCRQVAVCADYMAMTVRELDGYLKQSTLPVRPEPVHVNECLDDALALLAPRLESASAHIERRDDEPRGPTALADRRLLVHALVNLLKNAVEAAATGGVDGPDPRIKLSARARGDLIAIEVADSGPGIPPEELPRIFEDGYSTKGAGRGRGLAVVRESVAAQGGTIEVESRAGTGTVFTICLPRASGSERGTDDGRPPH
jgi:signal transduction histidine kinase